MNRGRHLDAAPRKIHAAAGHEIERLGAERAEVFGQLVGRDERGAVQVCERHRIGNVVLVRVRAEHVVARHLRGIDAAVRVFLQVGIEDEAHARLPHGYVGQAVSFEAEARMAEESEAHGGRGQRTKDQETWARVLLPV